jgi:hypothetical protein
MTLAILDDAEVDPIIMILYKRMIARFLHQASELFRKSLNFRLGLGKIGARGIELVLEDLNTLGIMLVLTWPRTKADMMLDRLPKKPYRLDIDFKE